MSYHFLLPGGRAPRYICIAEPGGPSREFTADEVAGLRQVAESCRMLLGLCLFCANADAFDSGVSHNGSDEGRDAARRVIDDAEKSLAAVGIRLTPSPEDARMQPGDPNLDGKVYDSDPFPFEVT